MTGCARALLVLLVLVGFCLRVLLLDSQSLWYDEGVTATITQRDPVELTRWTANDIQPPLYYYVVAGWGAWPDGVSGAALPIGVLWRAGDPAAWRFWRCGCTAGRSRLAGSAAEAVHPLLVYSRYKRRACIRCWCC